MRKIDNTNSVMCGLHGGVQNHHEPQRERGSNHQVVVPTPPHEDSGVQGRQTQAPLRRCRFQRHTSGQSEGMDYDSLFAKNGGGGQDLKMTMTSEMVRDVWSENQCLIAGSLVLSQSTSATFSEIASGNADSGSNVTHFDVGQEVVAIILTKIEDIMPLVWDKVFDRAGKVLLREVAVAITVGRSACSRLLVLGWI